MHIKGHFGNNFALVSVPRKWHCLEKALLGIRYTVGPSDASLLPKAALVYMHLPSPGHLSMIARKCNEEAA